MPTIYRDVADDVAARILQGEFPAGGSLPSEHELAAAYGVSRSTVRRALGLLRDRGELSSHRGASWTVTSVRQSQDFEQLRSFAQWANSRGMVAGGLVISSTTTPATVADRRRLQLGPDDDVLRVVRVRLLDNRRVMLERTVYATWMIPVIHSLRPSEPSVVQTLATRFGIVTARADNTLDAVAATAEDADLLGVRRASPLLRLRRQSFEAGGRPIEHSDDRYIPGIAAFQVNTGIGAVGMRRTAG